MYGRNGAAVRSTSNRHDRAVQNQRRAVTAFRQPQPPPQSVFPELDTLRQRFPANFLAWVQRRAAALGVGADRVLVRRHRSRHPSVHDGGAADLCRCPTRHCRAADAATPAQRNGAAFPVSYHLGARLQAYVLRHCGEALGARAANALRTVAPEYNAAPQSRSRAGRWLAIIAAAGIAAFTTAPDQALAATNIKVSLLFLAWMAVRLLGIFTVPPDTRRFRRVADADLPVYSVIAAVYREAASVTDLVAALRQIDWPPEKLDVKLVVEADDVETRATITRLDLPPWFDVIVARRPDHAPSQRR